MGRKIKTDQRKINLKREEKRGKMRERNNRELERRSDANGGIAAYARRPIMREAGIAGEGRRMRIREPSFAKTENDGRVRKRSKEGLKVREASMKRPTIPLENMSR